MESFLATLISGAVLGTVITGLFNIYSKNREYKQSYLKMILEKRINAYERINAVIMMLKVSTLDNGKAYHQIFIKDKEYFFQNHMVLKNAFEQEFWLSDNTRISLKKLHDELIRCIVLHEEGMLLIDIGKQEYQVIGKLRDEVEKNLLSDLPELYKIDKFFKLKNIETQYIERDLSERPI